MRGHLINNQVEEYQYKYYNIIVLWQQGNTEEPEKHLSEQSG